MSERFCYILERTQPTLESLSDGWSMLGLKLENPRTGLISCLTIAGDEQVDHTLFDRRFRAGSVTFQLWIERESDVICSYQQLDIGAEQIYWVDGLSSEQVERITTWALNRFQALAPEEIPILTVIELASNTGPEDWRLFVKQRVLPVGIPKMIAVKSEWTPLFASVLPNAKPMDGYEILSRLT